VRLPPGHEHAFDRRILRREEVEYEMADALLCPSDFVVKTFVQYGFPREKLVRFFYGVDLNKFFPGDQRMSADRGPLKVIFVGVCAVRKGLHFALEAWLASNACTDGEFLIVGDFLPDYRRKLAPMLSHRSVKVLGHRDDVPDLMRRCHVFVLPSLEEGFGLVCTEAMASGCVPLVSQACTELCRHMVNSLVHRVGDVDALRQHIDLLNRDRALLMRLRAKGLEDVKGCDWEAAGKALVRAYVHIVSRSRTKRGLSEGCGE